MSSDQHVNLTDEQAADLARRAHAEKWMPVPGFPSPEDPIGNSHTQEEVGEGWIFTPTTSNINRDPRLAESHHRYAVRRDGVTVAVPYIRGREAAEAHLVRA